jgi:hypothetical protein
MLYLFEPGDTVETAIKEYFSYKVLGPGSFGDLLNGGQKIIVYDCVGKTFRSELADLLLRSKQSKVFVVVDHDIGLKQTEELRIYYYKKPVAENIADFNINLIHKVAWLMEPDEKFDHRLYLEENPGLIDRYYNTPWAKENGISERQKAYHHYLLHAAMLVSSSKKNLSHEEVISREIKSKIKAIVDSLPNKAEKRSGLNRLECVCLNMTHKERKEYDEFVARISESTDPEVSRRIDFMIVMNNDEFDPDTRVLSRLFKSVRKVSLKMSAEEDIYVRPGGEGKYLDKNTVPKYGLKSGPNLMFLKTMDLLKKYDTSLLIETDCYLGKDWLGALERYTLWSNGFWISGATYDGGVFTKAGTANLCHLNGVALYATGHRGFQALIGNLDSFIVEYVSLMPHLAYDFAIKLMVDFGVDFGSDHGFWVFVNRNYVVNKHIFNFSSQDDKDLDEEEIRLMYNYAVLHKKTKGPSTLS